MENKKKKFDDVYHIVNSIIVKKLEQGILPWRKDWSNSEIPTNLSTLDSYKGINLLLLSCYDFERNYFLTYSQAKEIGAKVKEKSAACPVVYWKAEENPNNGELKFILKYYNVYNISQCDNVPKDHIPQVTQKMKTMDVLKSVVKNMPDKPSFEYHEKANASFYDLRHDCVCIPHWKHLPSNEAYYDFVFRELVNSTKHSKRVGWHKEEMYMPNGAFTTELLIGEIGSCLLNAHAGIASRKFDETVGTSTSSWIDTFKKNKKMLVYAGGMAQKAVDYILNIQKKDDDLPL